MRRATAGKWRVYASWRGTKVPYTGGALTITATISVDGGAEGAIADTNPTEIGNGFYDFTIADDENDGYKLTLTAVSSTSGVEVVAVPLVEYTEVDLVDAPNATALTAIYDAFGNGSQLTACATATGFATPTNVTDARDAILTQGNSAWVTATSVSLADGSIVAATFGADAITAAAIADGAFVAANFAANSLNGKGDWNTVVPPSVSEFNARTILAAAYATATALTDGTVQVGTVRDGAIGAAAVADIFSTTTLAEAYAAASAEGTVAQLLYMIQQSIHEFGIVDTTRTVRKLDGTTTAATFTLDDATSPTDTKRET